MQRICRDTMNSIEGASNALKAYTEEIIDTFIDVALPKDERAELNKRLGKLQDAREMMLTLVTKIQALDDFSASLKIGYMKVKP